jgi:glucose/arabinose dehydrogenase
MSVPRTAYVAILALGISAAACNQRPAEPTDTAQVGTSGLRADEGACTPVETRPPNATDQRPAFPGQARACAAPSNVAFDVVVLGRDLEHPWAVEPLPDGNLLVTERPGRMRIVTASGRVGPSIAGVPAVDARGQGGLLDVALSPSFDTDRTIFWSFAEPREGGNGTSVARGVLATDGRRLEDVHVIFRAMPTYDGDKHFGSRIVFGPDGMLYVAFGERSDAPMRAHAQRLDGHLGKVVRITPEGMAPRDNPFMGRANTMPEIWTLGHRNIQAAAFDGRGRLWVVEHGTQGGDELNLIEQARNYGWPLVAYGEEYSGMPIPDAVTSREGFEPPVYYWDPVIAPSGAEFYDGNLFPEWRGSLFTGSLKDRRLVRLTIEDNRVTGEEHLLSERGQRVRDVREGPDGSLYIVTDEAAGELWKIVPRRR